MTYKQLVVAFDADDTLWDNESTFAEAEAFFREIAAPWAEPAEADAFLVAVERRNLGRYGYGARSFGLSMIEAALELSEQTVDASVIAQIVAQIQELLDHVPVLIPGAVETVTAMAKDRRVLIITKGDLLHQQQRVKMSGLDQVVEAVEVVSEKDVATYADVARRHNIDPATMVMVGNSLKSDVVPVVHAGGRAIHIPFHITWALEHESGPLPETGWVKTDAITDVPDIVEQWEQERP